MMGRQSMSRNKFLADCTPYYPGGRTQTISTVVSAVIWGGKRNTRGAVVQALGDTFVQGLCIASWLFMRNVLCPWLLVIVFSMSNIGENIRNSSSDEFFLLW